MVRNVKIPLEKIIGKALLSFTELQTALIQIEAVVNSRLITYVYNDHQELEALTPGHFLVSNRLTT